MAWRVIRFIFGIALCALSLPAIAETEDASPPPFDLKQMPALLDVFAAPEKALSLDPTVTQQIWAAFLAANHVRFLYGPFRCGTNAITDSRSAMRVDLWLVTSPDCPKQNSTANVGIELKNADETQALRRMIEQRFGPSDPKCTNEKTAFWSLRPGYSLRWSSLSEMSATITLIANDAPDANCTVSSVKGAPLLDQAQLNELFQRVKSTTPPWKNPGAMEKWLSDYGTVQRKTSQYDKCRRQFDISQPPTLSGIRFIWAETVDPDCKQDEPSANPPRILLTTVRTDMFAETRFRNALTKAFGEAIPACHEDDRDIWKVSDGTVAVIALLGEEMAAVIYDIPLEAYECGKK